MAPPAGTVYGAKDNFRTQRILVAAQYSGANVKVKDGFKLGVDNKTEDFTEKFPFGQVPAFSGSDGKNLSETAAISFYVGEKVSGNDHFAKSQVQQWVSLADQEFLPAVLGWVLPSLSTMPFNKQTVETAKSELLRLLAILNDYLLPKTFLVGERITLADISLSCNLLLAYRHVLDAATREPFINVNRWFLTCVNQPEFLAVLGATSLCEKPAQFDAKKLKELESRTGAGAAGPSGAKKEGKKDKKGGGDEKKGKGGGEKAAKKKADPAAAAEEMDATEEAMAAEPKSKDPFEKFNKGSFVMDEFKRVFSNEDIGKVAIPYFWDHFDKEHYSIWFCEYKYPEDLRLTFMSCNLITGMMQRLDKMRKNAFGSMILFGENNNSTISGVWVWRGHELAFELSSDWTIDYESYDWKKLDPTNAQTKKMVNEYFLEQGDFDGKKVNEGKIFK
jgi:elongation factor 1-gamma